MCLRSHFAISNREGKVKEGIVVCVEYIRKRILLMRVQKVELTTKLVQHR